MLSTYCIHYRNANNFHILIFTNLPNLIFIHSVFTVEILTCIFNLTKLNFNKYLYFPPNLHSIFFKSFSSNLSFQPHDVFLCFVICRTRQVCVHAFSMPPLQHLGASSWDGSPSFPRRCHHAVCEVRVSSLLSTCSCCVLTFGFPRCWVLGSIVSYQRR
jgi:hypothetical protein